jgi:hypothetical protein
VEVVEVVKEVKMAVKMVVYWEMEQMVDMKVMG